MLVDAGGKSQTGLAQPAHHHPACHLVFDTRLGLVHLFRTSSTSSWVTPHPVENRHGVPVPQQVGRLYTLQLHSDGTKHIDIPFRGVVLFSGRRQSAIQSQFSDDNSSVRGV
jgi:hypothetical protein